MTRYVIIGSGAAGIAASEAIRSLDTRGEITLISHERQGYYSRPGLAYMLTDEIPEAQLYPFQQGDFSRLNLRRVYAEVIQLDPERRQIAFRDSQRLTYDRLLLATGASAARLRAPGAELDGVFKLDNLEDVHLIQRMARRGKRAIVVGGGITALEIVEGLRAHRVEVHYLLRGDRYWSNVLDETESHIIQERLQEEGVRLHMFTELDEVLGKNGRVRGVRTKDGRELKADMLGVAIGVRPRLDLANSAGIKTDRGVLVNEYLQSSLPDIYAAGDVAQAFDPLSKQYVIDSLWGPARAQGYTAGLNMAGQPTEYIKAVPFNVTRLANLTTTIIGTVGRGDDADLIGIARGDSETWRRLPDAIAAQSDFDVNRLRVLIGERSLIGAIVMGDQTLSHPLYHLIVNRVDISRVREQLLSSGACLGDILIDFWTEWRVGHAQGQPT